jgi:hypothetical protein
MGSFLPSQIAIDSAVFPEGTSGHQLDVLARKALWRDGLNYGVRLSYFFRPLEGKSDVDVARHRARLRVVFDCARRLARVLESRASDAGARRHQRARFLCVIHIPVHAFRRLP